CGTGKSQYRAEICAPFDVIGRTIDEGHTGHGVIIEFQSRVGDNRAQMTILDSDLDDMKEVIKRLRDAGFWIATKHERGFSDLLNSIDIKSIVRTLSKPGLHGDVFLTASGQAFGPGAERYRLKESVRVSDPLSRGNLDDWLKASDDLT